jgi:regulator of protease activity HflC (stomatin/prohibitin superfamily)
MKWRNNHGEITPQGGWAIGIAITLSILGLIVLMMLTIPKYKVWSQEMRGKAAFAEAEQNRRIIVEEAKARLEAEELNAQSEVARAKGMAEAMEIENGQLTETYNQYLFIRSLEELAKQGDLPQIIYLPSKGMLPVMDLK